MSSILTTTALRAAYQRASDPHLRESATVPLFEDICNTYLRDDNMSVYSQQPVSENRHLAVDLAVGYYDANPNPNLIFVLMIECKRHKHKDLGDLESQLFDYVQEYFDVKYGGLAKEETLYGAVGFGTKVRIYKCVNHKFRIDMEPVFGGKGETKIEHYRDVQTHGREILEWFRRAKSLRPAQTRPPMAAPMAAPMATPMAAPMLPAVRSTTPGFTEVSVKLSADGKFYVFKLGDDFQAVAVGEWRQEGTKVFHDGRRLSASLNIPALPTPGRTSRVASMTAPVVPTVRSTTQGFTEVSVKLSADGKFYVYELNGKFQAAAVGDWRQEGTKIFHDGRRLSSTRPK